MWGELGPHTAGSEGAANGVERLREAERWLCWGREAVALGYSGGSFLMSFSHFSLTNWPFETILACDANTDEP